MVLLSAILSKANRQGARIGASSTRSAWDNTNTEVARPEVTCEGVCAYSDDDDHRFRHADRGFRAMPITFGERRVIAALGVRFRG